MLTEPSYDSASRRSPFLQELIELANYRDLVGLFVSRINKTRYKRSSLGVIWTLLNPILNMAVLSLAFSQVFRSSVPHYSVYVLAGIIHWNFFSQTTSYAMNTMVWGGNLLKRVYLPRTIFAVAAIGNGLINFGIATAALAVIVKLAGLPFYPSWWIVPFAVLLLAMFSLGVALIMSTLAVFFTDVVEMYGVALQAWFFLTPIVYPKSTLPAKFVWLMNLNPAYNLLEMFRTPIYMGLIPGPKTIAAATVSAGFSLLLGWWVFTRKAEEIAYRI